MLTLSAFLFISSVQAKDKLKYDDPELPDDGIYYVDDEDVTGGEELEEGFLIFTNFSELEAKIDEIDKAFGYLTQNDNGTWSRSQATKSALGYLKHPTKNEWILCIYRTDGTQFKNKDTKIFTKEEKDKIKKKDEIESEYFTESI